MLVKMQGPDGPYWLRKKYDPKELTFSQRAIADIADWRGQGSVEELVAQRDGPFSSYQAIGELERDGKKWVRFTGFRYESCVDVEVKPTGGIGEIVAVPPEEAWKIALERDKKRKGPIV